MPSEFNLIDEPWIAVRTPDCSVKEISLSELFQNSQDYTGLAGEMKTQDFAILRMLLAIVHTVFSRYDEEGNEFLEGNTRKKAIAHWKKVWEMKRFPYKPFEQYFRKWHERFWLFDETYPFYQTASSDRMTTIDAAKLIGSFSQSGNKPRMFVERNKQGRSLTFSEAVRWLININAFDDIAIKPTPKKTWVGRLGLIGAAGENLFETLMLNYIPDKSASFPAWERDEFANEKNRIIIVPDNQAELLTLQSRRLLLLREKDVVTGCLVAGGDYFEHGDFNENMTIWKKGDKKEGQPDFVPKLHRADQSAWREFGTIVGTTITSSENDEEKGVHIPGVISWISKLNEYDILDENYMVNFIVASIGYDYKQATSLPINDSFSDTLSFHASLLSDLGEAWRFHIYEEIEKCEKAANYVWTLSKQLQEADGASGKDISGNDARRRYFERIDRPFRQWLRTLTLECDFDEYKIKLEKQILTISIRFGEELANGCSDNALIGRYKKSGEKDQSQSKAYSAAKELNFYAKMIYSIFKLGGESHVGQ